MNLQQEKAARTAMIGWLSDPHELGNAPAKIENAGTFDLYGMRYYLFRYKKSLFGKWLLGVCGGYEDDELEHCGHVFSEMRAYNKSTAKQDAVRMVEMIRAYWMEQARRYSE